MTDGQRLRGQRARGKFEIESADDFFLPTGAHISVRHVHRLLPQELNLSNIANVRVEIYRVFPNDSDVGRTSGPPTLVFPSVPTRVNSPSDVALDDRFSADGNLAFMASLLNATFTANNSVQPGGIHPMPNQTTGGDEAFTGEEVHFVVDFTTPFNLAPGHYFFVPQVELTGTDEIPDGCLRIGRFVSPGTPFPANVTDLQAWTRDANLDPDWLRIGTDIVGGNPAPTLNGAFSLTGIAPDTGSTALLLGTRFGCDGVAKAASPDAVVTVNGLRTNCGSRFW